MRRAFLYAEGVLATELASATPVCMSEEFLRTSLLRGLIASAPDRVSRVVREMTASWAGRSCFFDPVHSPTRGRPIQHDIGVQPCSADAGLACEAKWLQSASSVAVAQDLLKPAISRSTDPEGRALRTYLLIGGNLRAIGDTLKTLRSARFNLRWSRAGRGSGLTPAPTTIQLAVGISSHFTPRTALEKLISWGSPRRHLRNCPSTWASVRASLRARWYKTVVVDGQSTSWRLLLWEIDHRSVDNQAQLDWPRILGSVLGRQC